MAQVRSYFFIILILTATLVFSGSLSAKEKSCSCPPVSCGPCQKKVSIGKDIRFCSWGEINVCKKIICENVNYYFGCLSQLKKQKSKGKSNKKGEEGEQLVLSYEVEASAQLKPKKVRSLKRKKSKRNAASLPRKEDLTKKQVRTAVHVKKENIEPQGLIEVKNDSRVLPGESYSDKVIGKIEKGNLGLKVFHRGNMGSLKSSRSLYIGDEILNKTSKVKRLQIRFNEGIVRFVIGKKSKVILKDPYSIIGRFQPFVHLVYGGVEVEADLKEGGFDILAGQMLARVKKGKVRVKYEVELGNLKVKVESLKGQAKIVKAHDLSGESIDLKQGKFISWMSETSAQLFSMDEKQGLAGEGFLTPVFEMSHKQKQKLGIIKAKKKVAAFADWSKKKAGRGLASVSDDLCQGPSAQFQQCAWSCEGNPEKAGDCQAQKPGVNCVRRMCNAAGQWSSATPFASSYRDLCPAQGVRVGSCTP